MIRFTATFLSLFLGVLIWVPNTPGQFFEGKVVYQNSYESKRADFKNEQLESLMGTMHEYLIKGGNYRSSLNGRVQWQLYLNRENKLYSKMANSDTIFWNDASINEQRIISVTSRKKAVQLLGYECDEVTIKLEDGIEKYYFNAKLGVNISLFRKHLYGNWYTYLKAAKAVPLKMIIENEDFILTAVATKVVPMKASNKEFVLPPNAKIEKSPY